MKNTLSPAIREYLDKWNLRYPPEGKQSGIFEALRVVQEENKGSLTIELMDAVADYLEIPKIAVYEVATFYSLYHLQPVGRYVIDVCNNISCGLNGAHQLIAHIKQRLGIDVNETTADGLFTLREVECLGACVAPPVCQIGKKFHEQMTTEKMDELLQSLGEGSHG